LVAAANLNVMIGRLPVEVNACKFL
jgi:hypothetical protein